MVTLAKQDLEHTMGVGVGEAYIPVYHQRDKCLKL